MLNVFKGTKLITVIFIAISVVFIGFTSVLYVNLAREKAEKTTLRNELAEVMKQRKKLSLEVEELKLIKGDLEVKLGGVEAQNEILAENYEREKSQSDAVKSELTQKAEELKNIETQLGTATGEKETLQEMLDAEKAKYNQLRERVDKLVEVKEVLEEKVREIINKQGIELERIVIKAEGELEGKVLVVNREYNFIVVDIGTEDDVELGDLLTVFSGGKYIGEAQVEKIYDTMSAATIVKEIKSNAITVDDNVIVRHD